MSIFNKQSCKIKEPLKLALGGGDDWGKLTADSVKEERERALKAAEEVMQYSYDLILLEAQIRCSEYHAAKKEFSKKDLEYGYLNTYVRRDKDTNSMRFSKRAKVTDTFTFRKNLRMSAGGYSIKTLRGNSKHDEELYAACETEDHYEILRKRGKDIRVAIRKVRRLR